MINKKALDKNVCVYVGKGNRFLKYVQAILKKSTYYLLPKKNKRQNKKLYAFPGGRP